MPRWTKAAANFRPMTVIVPSYIALIAATEALATVAGPLPAALGHAALIILLLNHFIILGHASGRAATDPNASYWFMEILPIVALVPLLRLLQLTTSAVAPSPLVWYGLSGALLLIAVALTARLLDLAGSDLGLTRPRWLPQLAVGLSGLPLGAITYLVLRPQPLLASLDWREVAFGTLIIILVVAFPGELLFRGLLQRRAVGLFGRAGLFWSSALFAAIHVTSRSVGYVLFAGLVGLLFGWLAHRSGTIWGVVIAHGLLASGLVLVWPHLLR